MLRAVSLAALLAVVSTYPPCRKIAPCLRDAPAPCLPLPPTQPPCPLMDAPPPCKPIVPPCQMDLPAPPTQPPCIQMDPTTPPCRLINPCPAMDTSTPPPCRSIQPPCVAMDPPTPSPCRPIQPPCVAMDPPSTPSPPCLPQAPPCGFYDAPAPLPPCGTNYGYGHRLGYDAAPIFNECPDGWTRYHESCYFIERQEKKTLQAAETTCIGLDATLFVADSMEEYEEIIQRAPRNTWTWLGLVRQNENDIARWHTAANMDYKDLPWLIKPYSDSSNGWSSLSKCAAHWNPDGAVGKYNYYYPCSYSFYYVCEKNATLPVPPKNKFLY